MRTIAIMNNKGGVGKTVTAINLADILVRDYRQRVILADCDGQMNLTRFYCPDFDPERGTTLYHILSGTGQAPWRANMLPLMPGLDLLPGSLALYSLDLMAMAEGEDVRQSQRLAEFAAEAAASGEAEYLIFDCPPGFTAASMAALRTADEVVIPMTMDGFSVYGLSTLVTQLEYLRRRGARARVAGVLIVGRKHTEFDRDLERVVRSCGLRAYETAIRYSDKVPESTAAGRPLSQYSLRCAAAVDYRRWVREFVGGAHDVG